MSAKTDVHSWSLGVGVILPIGPQHPTCTSDCRISCDPCFVARKIGLHAMPIGTFQQPQQDNTEENAYTALLRLWGYKHKAQTHNVKSCVLQQLLAQQPIPHHLQLLQGLADLAQDYRVF